MRNFISKQEILQQTDGGFRIFEYYLSDMMKSGRSWIATNPWREDNNPSLSIYRWEKNNQFYFRDPVYPDQYTGNCFELVARFEGLTCQEHFKKIINRCVEICKELGIELTSSKPEEKLPEFGKPISATPVEERPVTARTREYLEQYGLTPERAKQLGMIPVDQVNVKHDCGQFRSFNYPQTAFIFRGVYGDKCYRPRPKQFHQISYSPDYRFELGDYVKSGRLVLCAGEKDAVNLYNQLQVPTMALLGEGVNPGEEVLELIEEEEVRVVVLYDNDQAGREHAERLKEKFGFLLADLHSILPRRYRGKIKDVSDYIKEGLDIEKLRNLILKSFPEPRKDLRQKV